LGCAVSNINYKVFPKERGKGVEKKGGPILEKKGTVKSGVGGKTLRLPGKTRGSKIPQKWPIKREIGEKRGG